MPRAVATSQTFREELSTIEGGFVVIRKMNYGERLRMRELGMLMQAEEGEGGEARMTMETRQQATQCFEFKTCVVDHNLTDEVDQPLDFRSARDVLRLDGKVASEIEQLIDKYNSPEDIMNEDAPKGPLVSESGNSSKEQTKTTSTSEN